MGPRVLTASPWLAPWNTKVSGNRAKNVVWIGGQGGLPPQDASPFFRRWGTL